MLSQQGIGFSSVALTTKLGLHPTFAALSIIALSARRLRVHEYLEAVLVVVVVVNIGLLSPVYTLDAVV